MKKKRFSLISIVVVCLLAVVYAVHQKSPQPGSLSQVEQQVTQAIGDEWEKQKTVQITPLSFTNNEGDEVIYYVCETTYFHDEIPQITGLDPVLEDVIDPATAEESRACSVCGLDAMLYQKQGRAYLCWTVSPEYSLAIEYDPKSISESKILKMAESVPANTEHMIQPKGD